MGSHTVAMTFLKRRLESLYNQLHPRIPSYPLSTTSILSPASLEQSTDPDTGLLRPLPICETVAQHRGPAHEHRISEILADFCARVQRLVGRIDIDRRKFA